MLGKRLETRTTPKFQKLQGCYVGLHHGLRDSAHAADAHRIAAQSNLKHGMLDSGGVGGCVTALVLMGATWRVAPADLMKDPHWWEEQTGVSVDRLARMSQCWVTELLEVHPLVRPTTPVHGWPGVFHTSVPEALLPSSICRETLRRSVVSAG